MLPTTTNQAYRPTSIVPEYLRRMFAYNQMDLEYTFWQMFLLCVSPMKAYKNTKYHKQTKNQWARDDPAFVAIMSIFMGVTSFAYAIAFNRESWFIVLRVMFSTILVDFILVGVSIATIFYFIANKFLRVPTPHGVEQSVEWLYAFDIHCNGFFPLFLMLYVLQYFLLPVILLPNFISTLAANILYLISIGYYFHITALGYSALPFLQNTEMFYYPSFIVAIFVILCMMANYNIAYAVMNLYFG